MPKIKIATAQHHVSKAVEKNGMEIRKLIKKAHSKNASLIHFCEGALSGYTKEQLGSPEKIDFEQIRIEVDKIQSLCKVLEIWAVFGCAHRLSDKTRPHNSLYIISDKGKIINRYDKRKLSNNELQNWYTPGFESCTFEIQGVKFGCALCIEIQFPEIFIEAEQDGVHCLLFSTYSRDKMFGIQAQGYAATNNYWISMAIPTNCSDLLACRFIGPDGEVLSKCRRNTSTLVINVIDTQDDRWRVPLKLAKPWRKLAREGRIYEERRVEEGRRTAKTII